MQHIQKILRKYKISNSVYIQEQLEDIMFKNTPALSVTEIKHKMELVIKDFQEICKHKSLGRNKVLAHLYNKTDAPYKVEVITKKLLSMFYHIPNSFKIRRSMIIKECTNNMLYVLCLDIHRHKQKSGGYDEGLLEMLEISNKAFRIKTQINQKDIEIDKLNELLRNQSDIEKNNKSYKEYIRDKDKAFIMFVCDILDLYVKNDVFYETKELKGNKTYIYYEVRDNIFYNKLENTSYETLPMVATPIDWSTNYTGGGYYMNVSNNLYSVYGYNPKLLFDRRCNNSYINVINKLQKVEYIISSYVNEYITKNVDKLIKNGEISDIGILKKPLPTDLDKPNVIDMRIKLANARYCSSVLDIADIFNKYNIVFYATWYIDFRFRLYTRGFPLSIQGSSLPRALITLKNPGNIEKLNNDEREIIYSIINKKQESALKSYEQYEYDYILSNIKSLEKRDVKIGLDATASAFQMIGLLLNDENMLKKTIFFKKNKDEDSVDIYTYFQNNLQEYMAQERISNITISRKLSKMVLMTAAYNQGEIGRIKTIMELSPLDYETAVKMSRAITKVINQLFPSLHAFRTILNEFVSDIAINNSPVVVDIGSPFGYFNQYYWRMTETKHKMLIGYPPKPRTVSFSTPDTNHNDITKTKIATMANLIHHMDATVMGLTIQEALKKKIPIVPIHDCFYTHPKYIIRVSDIYYKACKKVYLQGPLKIFITKNKCNVTPEIYEKMWNFYTSLPKENIFSKNQKDPFILS